MRMRSWQVVLSLLILGGISLAPRAIVVQAYGPTYTSHSPIWIMGNSGFITANGVTGGSGTPSDPYVISGWDINASNVAAGIVVKDTTAPFIIRNVYVHSGGNVNAGLSLSQD